MDIPKGQPFMKYSRRGINVIAKYVKDFLGFGNEILIFFKCLMLNYKLTKRLFPIRIKISDWRLKIFCHVNHSAKVELNGVLSFTHWLGNYGFISITLCENSFLIVDGDFQLGPESRVFVYDSATLWIGGKEKESASGITERAIILVKKNIKIGKDFLGSWGLYLTDSDHHQYGKDDNSKDVRIGDHVWVCPDCSILKGSEIGNNCVVAQKTVTVNRTFSDNSLIAGNPGVRIKEAKEWSRDINNSNSSPA